MGKLKTHKGAARRFKITGTGKIVHARSGRRHLMNHKPAKRGRRMRKPLELSTTNEEKIKRLLPYA